MAGYSGNRTTHQHRLNRIEGQVRGNARMVDEDGYCIDILTRSLPSRELCRASPSNFWTTTWTTA